MIRFMLALCGTLGVFALVILLQLGITALLASPEPVATTPTYVVTPLPTEPKQNVAQLGAVAITPTTTENSAPPPQRDHSKPGTTPYLEITTGCSLSVDDTCVTAHRLPTGSSTIRASLRIGTVLLLGNSTTSSDGSLWYEVLFDEPLRYPDRLTLPWYIPATAGTIHYEKGVEELASTTPTTTKSILVDRSDQKLYAYEGDTLVRTYVISTGLELSPTPRGVFTIYRKTPTRYMQGPIPGINTKYYDLPGVPWNLYFTKQGAVVHGAYWHNSFGRQYSSGCVNVNPKGARELYQWAELGMTITVRD